MEDIKSTRKKSVRRIAAVAGAGVLCSILVFAGTTILDGKAKTQTHAERASVPYIAASEAREETIRSRADAYKRELARRQEEARAEEEAKRKAAEEEKRKAEETKRPQARQMAQQKQRSPVAPVQRASSQPVRNAAPQQRTVRQAAGVRHSWTSHGSAQADVNRGYMIRQDDNFYAADIKTSIGKQIRLLRKGDIVSINGRKVMIDGEVYDNYNTGTVEGGRKKIEAKGYDYNSVCFQTCIPPYGGPIVIKFGHYV